jgi:catechol 2,3-dioxygenase
MAGGGGSLPADARLPAGTRVGRVRLQVAGLERSIAYYETVLGLRALRALEGSRDDAGAVLAPGGAEDGAGENAGGEPLIELRESPGAAPVPRQGRLGLYHFAILVPDRAALGRFVGHLAELGLRPGASDHLVSEALYLRDPDGLGIEVYADRPRSAWRRRDGELVMATEPLDLEDVARAGAGASWEGMPVGTTMGHVHLHVGELDLAAAFYEDALGLERTVWSYPGALFLSAGGYHHHLGLNTWAAGASPAGESEARLLSWDLIMPSREDVARAARRIEAAGYRVDSGTGGSDVLGGSAGPGVVVRDPWGTALRIRSERP